MGESSPLDELNGYLKGEFHSIGSYLKELKLDFKTFDTRLLKIEGKLGNLEVTMGQTQSEGASVRRKVFTMEKSRGS